MSLRRGLRRAGVATREINIWSDPDAAAMVRGIAGGNETVPTVLVGGQAMVNPPLRLVVEAVRGLGGADSSTSLPADRNAVAGPSDLPQRLGNRAGHPSARPLGILQWVFIAGLLGASFAVEAAGYSAASWGLDVLNVATYLGFRWARSRLS